MTFPRRLMRAASSRSAWTLLFAASLGLAAPAGAGETAFPWSLPRFEGESTVRLPGLWAWSPSEPDAAGAPAATALDRPEQLAEWPGIGWFVLPVLVTPDAAGRPLALRFRQSGAAEVRWDGRTVAIWGRPSPDRESFRFGPVHPPPVVVVPASAGVHRLAVRFAHPAPARYARTGWSPGFSVEAGPAPTVVASALADQRRFAGTIALFAGVFGSFAGLHLLLFWFYREDRANLLFALLCVVSGLLVFLLRFKSLMTDVRFVLISEPLMNLLGPLLGFLAARFVVEVFDRPVSLRVRALGLAALVVAVWGAIAPRSAQTWVFLVMLGGFAEAAAVTVSAVRERRRGARMVGLGMLGLAVGFGTGLLANLGVLPRTPSTTFLVPFASVVALALSMSAHLSREFATRSRDLAARLVQVRRLGEEKLAQERRAREAEIQRQLLEAEYERKVEELEEARRLQLSMLPEGTPDLAGMELAAHMDTATEVGGDYYDFEVGPDGELTVAVGDATGHGMRAGTLVTASKGLFGALANEGSLRESLARSAASLRRMKLRRLNMALVLARFQEGRVLVASAGMPPVLVHREGTGRVETVLQPGVPLGTALSFAYRELAVPFGPGDTALFVSDGLPERLNAEGEELGYDRLEALFREAVGAGSSGEVIERIRAEIERWAEGVEPADDATLVVVRRTA